MKIDTLTQRQIRFLIETLKGIRDNKPLKRDKELNALVYSQDYKNAEIEHLILYLGVWLE